MGLLDKDFYAAVDDYNNAILHGIVKIASKMGISTLQSYQSAQIFEAIGISKEVIDEYFTNTVSPGGRHRPEGDRRRSWSSNHNQAFDPLGLGVDTTLDSLGAPQAPSGPATQRITSITPQTIHLLQQAAQTGEL